MTRQFVILCSAQRLPYQDIDDKLAFGLNITAAIGLTPGEGSVTPQEAIALRPWAWSRITHVRVVNNEAGTGAFDAEVVPLPSDASLPDVDIPALVNELNEREYNPANECDLDGVTAWLLPETTASLETYLWILPRADAASVGSFHSGTLNKLLSRSTKAELILHR